MLVPYERHIFDDTHGMHHTDELSGLAFESLQFLHRICQTGGDLGAQCIPGSN